MKQKRGVGTQSSSPLVLTGYQDQSLSPILSFLFVLEEKKPIPSMFLPVRVVSRVK